MSTAAIHTGNSARELLQSSLFQAKWRALGAACPWATPLQLPEFVTTWFDHYGIAYEPTVITVESNDDRFIGLLVIARHRGTDRFVVAGAHQAEYQAWLSLPEILAATLDAMLRTFQHAFPRHSLRFKYLPPSMPCAELKRSSVISSCAEMQLHKRPLLRIRPAEIDESFRKKSNKSRFNRLARSGTVLFQRIHTADQFEHYFDEIIAQYDFRQGAVNDSLPFSNDPHKKAFVLDLLRKHPDLLHVTVTTLNEMPIAAHIGIIDDTTVSLAILAYSPFFSAHSPGKLHLMNLSRLLETEKIDCLDLTPGGDPWKERFANDHDEVWEMQIHPSALARNTRIMKSDAIALAKRTLPLIGLTPQSARAIIEKMRRITLPRVLGKVRRFLWERTEFRVYRHSASSSTPLDDGISLKRDNLKDILKFKPAQSWQTMQGFLSGALHRLEHEEHVYTLADEHRLLHYGWLIEGQKRACFSEVRQGFEYPEGSTVLYDFYTDPSARGRGLYSGSLRALLKAIFSSGETQHAYISVLADNAPSRHVIEKLGFEYQCSLTRTRLLGREKQSRSDGDILGCASTPTKDE